MAARISTSSLGQRLPPRSISPGGDPWPRDQVEAGDGRETSTLAISQVEVSGPETGWRSLVRGRDTSTWSSGLVWGPRNSDIHVGRMGP